MGTISPCTVWMIIGVPQYVFYFPPPGIRCPTVVCKGYVSNYAPDPALATGLEVTTSDQSIFWDGYDPIGKVNHYHYRWLVNVGPETYDGDCYVDLDGYQLD
jgi:hypothetical protein